MSSIYNLFMDKKTLLKKFGLNIKFERMKKEYSQEKLAEKLGVHRNYISKIETGEINMSLAKILELANTLEIDIKILLEFL